MTSIHHSTLSRHLSTWTEWILYSILFFLPWQTRYIVHQGMLGSEPWEYGTLSLYGVDLLVIGLIIISLIQRSVLLKSIAVQQETAKNHTLNSAQKNNPRPHRPLATSQWMAILFLFVALFSLNAANNSFIGLFWWLKLAEGIALFILVPSLHIRWERAVLAIIASAFIQSGLAIVQFVTQTVWGHTLLGMASQNPAALGAQVIDTGVERILRSYGSLPHPNMLAGWITMGIIASLVLLQHWKKQFHTQLSQLHLTQHNTQHQRVLYRIVFFALPILTTGLWTTLSRQAWVALTIVIILIITTAFIRERSFPRHTTTILIVTVTPFIVFSLLFPNILNTRFNNNTRLEHASIAERQFYTKQSVDLLRTYGLRGVGIGNYTAAAYTLDQQRNINLPGNRYQPVHVVALLVLTELGIFGLLALVLFIFHLIHDTSWRYPAQYCWSLLLIALAVISVFDHYLWTLHFGILLFWLIASLHEQSKRA